MEPTKRIPLSMYNEFTLNGEIPVSYLYFNDKVSVNSINWSNEYLNSFIKRFNPYNIISGKHGEESYKGAARIHIFACKKYINHIENKNIAVIGSQTPWIEAILVNAGAKSITTVDYNVPTCNHKIIKTISYDDFCKSNNKYDAIFSYSSIEHSGLGRYGDNLNPKGDIETMEQIYKSLNDDGLCFVGFPVGKDKLVWNAHRIYGEKRLKLLYLDKFKEIDWIGCEKDYIKTCSTSDKNPEYIQPIIILEK